MIKHKILKNSLFYCIVAALILRLTIYIIAWYPPHLMMGGGYMGTANAILDSSIPTFGSNADPIFQHPIGFGLIIAFFKFITGDINVASEVVRILAIVLDAEVCILIYIFCNNFFNNPRAGKIGAWVYAVLYPMIVNFVSLHPDSLAPFCVASMLAVGSLEMKEKRYALPLVGIMAGAFYYLRSEMLLYGLVLAAALLIQPGIRKRLLRISIMLICNVLMLTPWLIFTYTQVGTPVLSSTNAWGSAYEALGQYSDNPWGIVLSDIKLQEDAASRNFSSAWSMKANTYYKNEFFKAVQQHPDYCLKLIGRRLWQSILLERNLFFSQTIGGYTLTRTEYNRLLNEYAEVSNKGLQAKVNYLMSTPKALLITSPSRKLYYACLFFLLVSATLGLFLSLKKWRTLLPVLFFYCYYVLSISLLKQIEPKNMYAVFALLAILSGLGVERICFFTRKQIKLLEDKRSGRRVD